MNIVCVIFSIGLISNHLAPIIASPTQQSEPEASNSNLPLSNQTSPSPQPDLPQTDPPLPSLTCILFQNFGCNTECVVEQNLRQYTTTGSCTSDKVCSCTIRNKTLRDLWRQKFESRDVLEEIEKDEKLTVQVFEALRNPSRTAFESAQDLKSILSPELWMKLQFKRVVETAQPRPVPSALKQYVDKQLEPIFKSTSEFETLDYEKSLVGYLENEENNRVVQKVFRLIRQTGNEILVGILDQFLAQHKDIVESESDLTDEEILFKKVRKDLNTNEILTIFIIDELINEVDSIGDKNHGQPMIPPENDATKIAE